MGSKTPTEALPKSSAMMNTAINPSPENPALPSPTHIAAKETRNQPEVLSITPLFFSRSEKDSSHLSC
jgi:hypothetical protein